MQLKKYKIKLYFLEINANIDILKFKNIYEVNKNTGITINMNTRLPSVLCYVNRM